MKLRTKAAICSALVITVAGSVAALTHATTLRASSTAANGQLAWGGVTVANPDGTARHVLGLPWPGGRPVWSPDGSRLLVTVSRPNTPDRPATMNADGSGLTLLDAAPKNMYLECAAWSPDGTRLLCAGTEQDGAPLSVYSIRASDGGDVTRLTNGGVDYVADYSPDGKRFVFVDQKGDIEDKESGAIFVENTDGTGLHQITAYGVPMAEDFERVDWSPDGSEILFVTPHWSLDTVHPDGTGLKEIVHGQEGCPCPFDPTWSPDGTKIAYAYNPDSTFSDIYTANADGTHKINITKDSGGENWPSWGTHPLAQKCTAAEKAKRAKAVADYKRQMAAARRAYFRTHQSAKARAAYIKRQQAKLKDLERQAAACA